MTPEQQRITELEKENAELRKRDAERDRELRALREGLAKLRKEIEEWKGCGSFAAEWNASEIDHLTLLRRGFGGGSGSGILASS